jgi:leader peptidase (prepilin peptidase) / N-methyltransferase
MIRLLGTVLAALLGLAFGSFLNVGLSRWPEGESVVKPRSHCRGCGRTLTWWENVPFLSWLALRGRCRTCKAMISWRYPLVELAVGALWAGSALRFLTGAFDPDLPPRIIPGSLLAAIGLMILCWLLVALAALDAEHLWLPDALTLPGICLGLAIETATAWLGTSTYGKGAYGSAYIDVVNHAIAALVAAGLILIIRWTYKLIRRQEGIGLGDAKLMALLGAWLGLPGALLAFVIGVILGSIIALALLAVPKSRSSPRTWAMTRLPLGTFLCIGGIVSSLWGQTLLSVYLRWAGFN